MAVFTGFSAPILASPLRSLDAPASMSSLFDASSSFFSLTNMNIAGMKLKLRSLRAIVPKATTPPKTFTGMICIKRRTAKPAAVAAAV